MHAPIGRPPPRPFASVTTSGTIPAAWWANQAPVRPMPVCTSSSTSSAPRAAVISRAAAQVALGRHDHAGLAEDRLEHDRRGVGVDGGVQRGDVAVGHVRHPGRQRLERRPLGLLAGERQRAHGAAVEGVLGGHDVRAAGPPGHLERGLVRLGAGVAEQHARVRGVEQLLQPLGQAQHRLVDEEVRHVPELRRSGP